MTAPDALTALERVVSRAIHEHLSRRDIMQYLDNDEDCEGLARAVVAHLSATDNRAPVEDGWDRRTIARCIEIVRETREGFLSEQYATPQPLGSMMERFACDQVADAIENEFDMGSSEQRRLLGKPSHAEEYRAAAPTPPTGSREMEA